MDTKSEDKIVRQIEKSLSNNINDNLFLNGRAYENDKSPITNNSSYHPEEMNIEHGSFDNTALSMEYTSGSSSLSRAEYIRQAREACLRQMSITSSAGYPYDAAYPERDAAGSELLTHKKAKVMKLFHDNTDTSKAENEDTAKEAASFRFLVIRTVCAIVLFISIFMIDKFKIKIGNFSPEIVKQYVMGNDTLKLLENFFVTWLK